MARRMLSIAVGMMILGMPLRAHHAISAIYDSGKRVTVEGAVREFQFINPHPILVIEVADAGRTLEWRLEMDNRFELVAIGVTADTFKPGERVVVTGSIGRTQPQSLYVLRLDRPTDGFWYEQVGQSPRIGGK